MVPESPDDRVSIRDSCNKNVYARYCQAWRADRAPTRRDIDVFSLPRALPNIYIVEVLRGAGGDRFRVRLMGTGLVDRLKHECTGQFVRDLPLGGWEDDWRDALASVTQAGRPQISMDRARLPDGLCLTIEHVILPLSRDGTTIDEILGSMAFLGYEHEAEPAASVWRRTAYAR